jgi:hypothetical protein
MIVTEFIFSKMAEFIYTYGRGHIILHMAGHNVLKKNLQYHIYSIIY